MSGYTGPANPIIASGFYSGGKDISGTFQQFVVGPKPSVTGISINGIDVCNYFAPYYNGPKTNNVSGFMFNGGDLQSGFSPPYALSAGTTGTYIMPLIPSTLSIISCNLNTSPAIVTFTAPSLPNSISPATSTYTYKYYVNGSASGTAATVVSSTQASLTGISLSAGTSYTIKVTAVNAVGESPLSSATSTTAWTVPSVPTVTYATGSASNITFYFTQSSGTVTTYTAYYSTSSTFSTSYPNISVANNVTSSNISSGITTGSSYYVFLVANNLGGSSSNSAAYGPIATLLPPAAPTGLTLYGNPTSSIISFTFTAPSGTVNNYTAYYNTTNSFSGSTQYGSSITSSPATIGGLTGSTTYYLFLTATNAAGSSTNSVSLQARTTISPLLVSCGAPGTTTLIYSTDGVNWSAATTNPFSGGRALCAAYSSALDRWVAGGWSSDRTITLAYSTDGRSWSWATATNNTFWGGQCSSVAYSTTQNLWVAGGFDNVKSNCLAYSTDGITWYTSLNNPFYNGQCASVAYSTTQNRWVAGGNASGVSLAYSTNGKTWTNSSSTFTGSVDIVRSVSYSTTLNQWVATLTYAGLAYSSNGMTWTAVSGVPISSCLSVAYSDQLSQWILCGSNGANGALGYSTDGITWTKLTTGVFYGGLAYAAVYSPALGLWIAAGYDSPALTSMAYSTNGITWTASTTTDIRIGFGVACNS